MSPFHHLPRREIADQLGVSQHGLSKILRVSFAKVAEYQKRGLVRYLAVIRFDGPEGSTAHHSPARDR